MCYQNRTNPKATDMGAASRWTASAEGRIIPPMPAFRRKLPRVVLYTVPLANSDEWRVLAHCPGAPLKYISGFVSKAQAEAWASGPEGSGWAQANYQADADYRG